MRLSDSVQAAKIDIKPPTASGKVGESPEDYLKKDFHCPQVSEKFFMDQG